MARIAMALNLHLQRLPLTRALECVAFPALLIEATGRVIFANEQFLVRFGFRRANLLGRRAGGLFAGTNGSCERALFPWQSAKQTLFVQSADDAPTPWSVLTLALSLRLGEELAAQPAWLAVLSTESEDAERDGAAIAIGWRELFNATPTLPAEPLPTAAPAAAHASARELQIRMLDQLGCDTKRIAHVLSITPSTVRVIRARGLRKFNRLQPAHELALAS